MSFITSPPSPQELKLTPEEFQYYLHPDEIEREQGGIETSVEVHQQYSQIQIIGRQPSPSEAPSPQHAFSVQNGNEDEIEVLRQNESWLEEGEEWFWVWA